MGFKKVEVKGSAQVSENLPVKYGFWTKFKAFWLQKIDFSLTPQELIFEEKLNNIFNTKVTKKSIHDFLFQEISFGRKKKSKINVSVVEELNTQDEMNSDENSDDDIWENIEK